LEVKEVEKPTKTNSPRLKNLIMEFIIHLTE